MLSSLILIIAAAMIAIVFTIAGQFLFEVNDELEEIEEQQRCEDITAQLRFEEILKQHDVETIRKVARGLK